MKKFAEERWNSKGLLEVQRKEEDLFIFRFQSEDSKQSILDLSPLPFGNRVLFLWPWSPDKPIQRLSLDTVPVWIQFPDLRLHHFHPHVLSGLGSFVGKPLFMDKPTTAQTRVSFARICVEIKAGADLPKLIHYLDENGSACTQEVIYEWMPIHCPKCLSFGHNCVQPHTKTGASGSATLPPHNSSKPKPHNPNHLRNSSRPPKHGSPTPRHVNNVPQATKQAKILNPFIKTARSDYKHSNPKAVPSLTNLPSSSRPGKRSHNTFAPLTDLLMDENDTTDNPANETAGDRFKHPMNLPAEGSSQEDLNSDEDDDDLLDVDYTQTLADHIKCINTTLEKKKKDVSWYSSCSEEDNADNTPTELIQEPSPLASTPNRGPPSRMKSIITKGSNSRTREENASDRQLKVALNSGSSSLSPGSRPRNRSRGRPRGAKSKR